MSRVQLCGAVILCVVHAIPPAVGSLTRSFSKLLEAKSLARRTHRQQGILPTVENIQDQRVQIGELCYTSYCTAVYSNAVRDFVRGPGGNPDASTPMYVKLLPRTSRRDEVARWENDGSPLHTLTVVEHEGERCQWTEAIRLKDGDVVVDPSSSVCEIDLAKLGVLSLTCFALESF